MSKPVLPAKGDEKALNRCERVTVVQTQDWCFSEKELLYCKLTVGYRGLNLQLLVSFGAVQIWNFSMLKKAFLFRLALHELKKFVFFAKQKVFVHRKLYELSSKAAFCTYKKPFMHTILFLCNPKLLFSTLRSPFQPTLTYCPQKFPVFTNQKPFFRTNLFYCHPKQSFSTLRFPFQRPLTYCPPKNIAVLLMFALHPYAVKPEPRTDSNHCRRYPAKLPLFAKPVTWWWLLISAKITYRPAIWIVGRRASPRVLFGYFLHNAKSDNSFPFREAPRFRKPRISAPQPQLRSATIKTF